jgi:hypothetical protein
MAGFRHRFLASIAVAASCSWACVVGDSSPPPAHDLDDSANVVVLEGAELARELGESPPTKAARAFRRIAIEWTSAAPDGFEIAFSENGSTWSRWREVAVRHMEVDEHASYLGDVEVSDHGKATHYRLRATRAEQPTRIALRFLERSLDESMEDGEDVVGTMSSALSVPAIPPGLVLPRSAWGASAARCNGAAHSPNRITIHHTVTANTDANPEGQLRQIQSYHQGTRGWCDIGYHFLISRDGRIWEGRPAQRTASHVANANTNNIGIAFMGTFTKVAPTQAQLAAAATLVAELKAQYGIASGTLKGHRDHGGTECPGNTLYGLLPMIDGKGGMPPKPPTDPQPGQYVLKGTIHVAGNATQTIAGAKVTTGTVSTTTDQRGHYELTLAAGTHTILVTATGYVASQITRTLGGGGPAIVWGSVGLPRQGMAGTGTAALQGVVYRGPTTNRIAGATVFLDDGRSTIATANGYFRFDGLASRSYTVTASASGVGSGKVMRTAVDGTIMWASVAITSPDPAPGVPMQPSSASCTGHCGSEAPAPGSSPECYCDAQCAAMGDCCADVATACAAMPTGGSCQSKCGSTTGVPSNGDTCYCDPSCTSYGDCCADFVSVCGPPAPQQSCANRCGSSTPVGPASNACYCDAYCAQNGDCCSDFNQVCSGASSACMGRCGSAQPISTTAGDCYCDALCEANADCCAGYAATCP